MHAISKQNVRKRKEIAKYFRTAKFFVNKIEVVSV